MIEHTFPFLPAQDDWSMLLKTLMNQLDPVQILIRLKPMDSQSPDKNPYSPILNACERHMEAHQDGLPGYHKAKQLRSVVLKQIWPFSRKDRWTATASGCS